jgi:hypothetical protein
MAQAVSIWAFKTDVPVWSQVTSYGISEAQTDTDTYRVVINYRRISLRHNLSSKCRKIVKFVSITHIERDIWNDPIVATAITREKRKPVLEGNGYLTDRA